MCGKTFEIRSNKYWGDYLVLAEEMEILKIKSIIKNLINILFTLRCITGFELKAKNNSSVEKNNV